MRLGIAAFLLSAATLPGVATATSAPPKTVRPSAAPLTELSSQDTGQRRARPRIRITPPRQRDRLVRQCDFRLVREVRASGTYVVPQLHCWWARQR
jgi:hypothetical protein